MLSTDAKAAGVKFPKLPMKGEREKNNISALPELEPLPTRTRNLLDANFLATTLDKAYLAKKVLPA